MSKDQQNQLSSTLSTQFGDINLPKGHNQSLSIRLNKNDLQSLLSLFNSLDKHNKGVITLTKVTHIMNAIYSKPINISMYLPNLLLSDQKHFAFEDCLMIITDIDFYHSITSQVKQANIPNRKGCELLLIQLEIASHEQRRNDFLNNNLITSFLKILRAYQLKAQEQVNYIEAQQANEKICSIMQKQQKRWQHYLTTMQKYQAKKLEEVVDENFKKFSSQWDQYTNEYKQTALNALKDLKHKQQQQIHKLENDTRAQAKLKLSKQLLLLRNKQANLAKIKKYELAELVRQQADEIELQERSEMEDHLEKIVEKKVTTAKRFHQQHLMAFMLKVQKERNDHFLQRKNDSERLQYIRRNQQSDIQAKYTKEKNLFFSTRKSFNRSRLPQTASVSTRANDLMTRQYLNFTQDQIASDFSRQHISQ